MSQSFVLNLTLGASLNLLWSVINSLQIIAYDPIYGSLKIPSKVLLMNQIILTIVTFEFIDTRKLMDAHLYDLPEEDPYTLSFEYCK